MVHREGLQKVSFIVRGDRDYEVEKFERRRRIEVDGQPMWVISPEDLVLSKLAWNAGRCGSPWPRCWRRCAHERHDARG